MQNAPTPAPALGAGLETLMADGLRIYGVRAKPMLYGQQMLRAESPERFIALLTERHTVNGYTSHAALCETLADSIRDLHRHARKGYPNGRVDAWLTVGGVEYAVLFDDVADSWPGPGIVSVWINNAWQIPRDVLSPKLCEALDRAADAWKPEAA